MGSQRRCVIYHDRHTHMFKLFDLLDLRVLRSFRKQESSIMHVMTVEDVYCIFLYDNSVLVRSLATRTRCTCRT